MKIFLRSLPFLFPFIFFSSFSLSQVSISISAVNCSSQCATFEFVATGISQEFNHVGDYKIFWSFGDGFFHNETKWIGSSQQDVISTTYTYSKNAPHEIYVEAVPLIYEDNKPPARFNYDNGSGGNVHSPTCTSCPAATTTMTGFFHSEANRNFVPGDMVSYVLTYTNPCDAVVSGTISFEFPNQYLKVFSPPISEPTENPFISSLTFPQSMPAQMPGATTKYEWTYSNLSQNELRQIIIPLEVDPSAPISHSFQFDIQFTMSGGPEGCNPNLSFPAFPIIKNSHDPNDLSSPVAFTCDAGRMDPVRYVITFRNDGDTAAAAVLVKNVIPDFFDISTIDTKYPIHNGDPPNHTIDPDTREVSWDIRGGFILGSRALRGTNESGVFLEDCIDSLVFTIAKEPAETIANCEAIVNQAEIVFDCNPSFYTNPFILRYGCVDTIFVVDSINNTVSIQEILCDTCSEISIVHGDTIDYIPGPDSIPLVVDQSKLPPGSGLKFRWYPSLGMERNKIKTIDPKVLPEKNTDYYLVVSSPDTCHRTIYHVRVEFPCDLKINHEITCNGSDKSLTAWVDGNPPNIRWSDPGCSTQSTIHLSGMGNEFYTISVVDLVTGCSATKRIEMVCPQPPPPCWWCWGLAILGIAVVGILFFKSFG